MIHQKGRVTPMFVLGVASAIAFLFSLYVLATTENTTIVVNEAAQEPKEAFFTGESPQAPEPAAPEANPKVRIAETGIGFLNVRDGASLQANKVGTVKPQEVYEYTEVQDNWYRLAHPEWEEAWVSGQYVEEVDSES